MGDTEQPFSSDSSCLVIVNMDLSSNPSSPEQPSNAKKAAPAVSSVTEERSPIGGARMGGRSRL